MTNRITTAIISELTYRLWQKPTKVPDGLNDIEAVNFLVEEWLEEEFGRNLQNMPGIVTHVPDGLIPESLFEAALEMVVPLIDWEAVAANETIAKQLKQLREVEE